MDPFLADPPGGGTETEPGTRGTLLANALGLFQRWRRDPVVTRCTGGYVSWFNVPRNREPSRGVGSPAPGVHNGLAAYGLPALPSARGILPQSGRGLPRSGQGSRGNPRRGAGGRRNASWRDRVYGVSSVWVPLGSKLKLFTRGGPSEAPTSTNTSEDGNLRSPRVRSTRKRNATSPPGRACS